MPVLEKCVEQIIRHLCKNTGHTGLGGGRQASGPGAMGGQEHTVDSAEANS